jgi:PAS domain S-box-containing protein
MVMDNKKKFYKSEELYRRIMKLIREGIWIVGQDGIISFVNPYLAELLGYSTREMTGKHWFDFMNDRGIAVCQKNLESRKNDITEQDDFELFKKDGTCVSTKLSIAPICEKDQYAGIIALVADITDNKRTEETLQLKQEELIATNQELRVQTIRLNSVYQELQDKTEEIRKHTAASNHAREEADQRFAKQETILASERELLKISLNSLGEGVVVTDQNERIILINEAAITLTGYSQVEAIGEPLEKILYLIDDHTSEPRAKIVSHEIFNNLILVTQDLQEVPVSTDSSPIKTNDGVIIGTVTVFQDISEKLKTQQELLRAEKLESLGILAGGIAHDFNNVLAAILANIQLVMVKLKNDVDIKPDLINTMETTRKASSLTKQLLTFSKGRAPVKKDTSLVELIKDTAEFILRGTSIKLEFTMANDLWVANIDEGQISQVIHNLVLNAKQAMLKGGIIYISAENLSIEEGSRFNPGNYVKITVKDQGTGIAKENLLKIFDPYFTTKKMATV